jgi:hypothetical protein
MSNVLLLLNHTFVAESDAEAIVAQKKQELATQHPAAQVDQYLLSNVVLEKVSLPADHYDYIYYLDHSGFNSTIPNHPSIKAALKTSTTVALNKPASGSKVGSKLSKLKFKKLNQVESPISAPSPTPSLPELVNAEKKLRYFSDDSDDDELVDEDALVGTKLTSGSIICLREPNADGKKRRKACKDCTCGLAEREAFGFQQEDEETRPQVKFSSEELSEIDFTVDGKTGGCGSCSLGDAFRCSGCPFLGLPAFKPGQTITLDSIADDL